MKAIITQKYLSGITRPASGSLRIMDAQIAGFGVAVGKRRISFILRRRQDGPVRFTRLGEWPAVTVTQAREMALQMIAGMSTGAVQVAKKGAKAPTLQEATAAYIQFRTSSGRILKASTVRDMSQRIGLLEAWRDRRLNTITPQEVSDEHAKLTQSSGPVSADAVMRYFNAVYRWAAFRFVEAGGKPWAESPVTILTRLRQWNPKKRRQTFVSAVEFPDLWNAVCALPGTAKKWPQQAEIVADWCLLMIFTGMRPGEALRLECARVDLRRRVFVLEDSKTRNDFHLPFAERLATVFRRRLEYSAIVGSPFVFPALGHHGAPTVARTREVFGRLREGVPGLKPGDLRRTFVTVLGNMEPAPSHLVVKRLLNHTTTNANAADVTAGYFGADVERLRVVVERVADEIMRLTAG